MFFRKSNYIIDDYDLLGYGGGGEFELPIRNDTIFYHFSYSGLKPYNLKDFLIALQDFDEIKQKVKRASTAISKEEQMLFANKSELHKSFIECKSYKREAKFEIPSKGYIVNLEKDYLYKDYENKLFITGLNMDSIFLSVEDADVWKQDRYFVVKPKDGWTRRWLNVYAVSDTNKTKILFNQLFEILELPEPRIYFGMYYRDTIYGGYDAFPGVRHYHDDMHYDRHLDYELLSYTYVIKSGNHTDSFKIKSARGTNELHDRINKLQAGDCVTIQDVYVLYPDNTVKQINGRTVFVGDSN